MNIGSFRTLHSGRKFIDETLLNAKREVSNMQDFFYSAALYHSKKRLLPELLRLQGEQQAKVDSIAEQIRVLEEELNRFSDRSWLRKVFSSQREEDKRHTEITEELDRLNRLINLERPVLFELQTAIMSLREVEQPEVPSWLAEYLSQSLSRREQEDY
jgi:hypothetical protein